MPALLARLRALPNLSEDAERQSADPADPADQRDLHGLAEVLSAERFVSHDDDALRLRVACALAELFRISAPHPPVAHHKLRDLCSLFIEQLAVLVSPHDRLHRDRFSLLEQLATTKTFVLFADDHDVVPDLFACFYAVSSPHHAGKVREYFADILFSILDETEKDDISKDVLDALLAPFVRSLNYSQPAVALAENVLRLAANRIQVPLCSMLNASIRQLRQTKSTATPEKHHGGRRRTPVKKPRPPSVADDPAPVELSAHHDHIADIIVAVNRIAPDILIYVIPSLEDRIKSSDEEVRLASVHLLAKLFTSQLHMSESYPPLFEEFLSRNRDVSPAIRAEVCAILPKLMVSHEKHREDMDQNLRERGLDFEEDVRLVAVKSIGAAVDVASDELLKILATRLRDRKASVRHEALEQLVEIYSSAEHVSKQRVEEEHEASLDSVDIENDDNPGESGSIANEETKAPVKQTARRGAKLVEARMRKLQWLPNTLMEAHNALKGAGDVATASEIERVIFETIPGSKSDDEELLRPRLRRFAVFLGGLHDGAFLHFVHLAQSRRRSRDALLQIAEYRLRSRKNPPAPLPTVDNSQEKVVTKAFSKQKGQTEGTRSPPKPSLPASGEIRQLAQALSRFMYVKSKHPDEAQKLCLSLATAVDLKIFERIKKALDENASQAERSAAYQDAVSRLGSKSPVGRFFQDEVFPKCVPGVFSSKHFATACQMAVEEAGLPADTEELNEPPMDGSYSRLAICGVLRYLDVIRIHAPSLLQHNMESIRLLVSVEVNESDSSSDVVVAGLKLASGLPEDLNAMEPLKGLGDALESKMFAKKLFNVEQGASLAKWAARAAIRLGQRETLLTNPLSKLIQGLESRVDIFRGDLESLVAPLTSLSQMAKHCPKDFKSAALGCFDFARALLCGSLNEKVKSFAQSTEDNVGPSKRRRSQALSRRSSIPSVLGEDAYVLPDQITQFRASCMAEVVHRAVKLLVYSLSLVDSSSEEMDIVFQLLLNVSLEKRGDIFGVCPNDSAGSEDELDGEEEKDETIDVLCAISRLSAGHGMLYLARHPTFFRQVSPSLFVSAVLLAQDKNRNVRINFAKSICNQVLKKRLPFRWVVALPLMAVDPDRKNLTHVKGMMTTLFRHRRRIYDKARLGGSIASIQLLPESVLPDLIWVLANLPDVELDRESGFAESRKCLELMLDRLLESNEYAGVLNEYIESLSIAQDATETEDEGPGEKTERIAALGRISGVLLKKKQAGRKWNLSEHPGHISLPKDMFRVINRNAETSGVAPPSLLAVARMYDQDKIRVSSKKEKPSKFVSRIIAATSAKSVASSAPEDKREAIPSQEESSLPVHLEYDTKSRSSPVESVERLEEIEQDPEPIESKMGDALNCELPGTKSDESKRGKKRRSNEVEKSVSTAAEHSAETGNSKKRRSSRRKSMPTAKAKTEVLETEKKPSGKKRRSFELDEASSVSDGVAKKQRYVKTASSGEKGDEKATGSALVAGREPSAKRVENASDGKENEAGNSQKGEGQSRRTLPRAKQQPKKASKPKGKKKGVAREKKVAERKNGDGAVAMVRRSRRRRI